jgi:hypothetical protein
MSSIHTVPVNQSAGPGLVAGRVRVISMIRLSVVEPQVRA